MVYNAEIEFDAIRAKSRLEQLISGKKRFELKEIKTIRSLSQNSYLHLILGWFALEYGERLEYIKVEYFKRLVNPQIFEFEFVNRKTGEVRTELKSTADLTTSEMTIAIDRFRDYASKEAGIYLPEPKDLVHLQHIKDELHKNKLHL